MARIDQAITSFFCYPGFTRRANELTEDGTNGFIVNPAAQQRILRYRLEYNR